ncbi:unnamed protein product [Durusdinium trenchii]|uniref:Uncharacterized protein n=2 Tax=Durusdinium trenchii TaxID=1381693 RepID=A0ABP0JA53_9DINO
MQRFAILALAYATRALAEVVILDDKAATETDWLEDKVCEAAEAVAQGYCALQDRKGLPKCAYAGFAMNKGQPDKSSFHDMRCLYQDGPFWHHGKARCTVVTVDDQEIVTMTCDVCMGEKCMSVYTFAMLVIGLLVLLCCCCCCACCCCCCKKSGQSSAGNAARRVELQSH